jgi:hypothetical protein
MQHRRTAKPAVRQERARRYSAGKHKHREQPEFRSEALNVVRDELGSSHDLGHAHRPD